MKKAIKICVFAILFFVAMSIYNYSHAASAKIGASKTSIKVGESVNVTVSINAAAWNVTVSGPSNKKIVGDNANAENESKTETISFKPTEAGSYTFSISGDISDATNNETLTVSDSVTITVTEVANNGGNTGNTGTTSKPEQPKTPTFKSVNEKVYATGTVNVRKSYSTQSDKVGSLKEGEEITRTGIANEQIDGVLWSKITYNGATAYVSSNYLTKEQPKKSEDKTLKLLEITGLEIDPAFDSEITDYAVTVGSDVEKIEIKAVANDEKAKVDISGNENFQIGDNLLKIAVTAEDQTVRTYTINVTKQAKESIALSTLKVAGYNLSPKFSPDVTEYKMTVSDPNVSSLNITALSSSNNAKIETTGNTNLTQGNNTVLIKVTSEDGMDTVTYKIVVTKEAAVAAVPEQSNFILYAGIGVIVFLVILIIAVIVIAKKKSAYQEYEDYDDESNDFADMYGYSSNDKDVDNKNITKSYEEGINKDNTDDDYYIGKNSGYAGDKDVNYYNNKISEIFDNKEQKNYNEEHDIISNDVRENYNYNEQDDNDWDDDSYRTRRGKGKHSK